MFGKKINDREKLVELLTRELRAGAYFNRPRIAGFADYLIANGVVIQKEAEWIEHIETLAWCEDDVDVFYKCSVCGTYSPDTSPYCPKCGAKMKEVK